MAQYVYHFKPVRMTGTRLLPLNELAQDLREDHLKKYRGREEVIREPVPPLECSRVEVVHLAPIDPRIIVRVWREHGFDLPKRPIEVIRIPSSFLDESRTVIYLPYGKTARKDFFPFRHETYRELSQISESQLEDWRDQRRNGFPLFWFSSTEHVLTRCSVEVSGCEIFTL
jgi:hypothetical protein